MKSKFLNLGMLIFILLLNSCRDETLQEDYGSGTENAVQSKVTIGQYTSALPYNVNVVYFIPSDVPARPEYERRISQSMLAAQEYYRQNMYNWGYGNRTFGLLKNPSTNRIKINIVHGAKPISSYPYSAGGQILQEVNTWFAAHPSAKTSEHTIIFTAVPAPGTNIPYYGLGKTCFVGDHENNDYQYFNQNTAQGNQAKAYMGGLLHELGHALNLPHDALSKKLQNVAGYGTSLMGWGNQTYGHSSTILTKASAAILNNCQVFSPVAKPAGYFYKQNHNFQASITSRSISNGRIQVWGNFSVGSPITSLNIYFIPKDSPYHAISGIAIRGANNTYYTYVDVADLYFTNKEYSLVVQGQFADGGSSWQTFPLFTFVNGNPVLK